VTEKIVSFYFLCLSDNEFNTRLSTYISPPLPRNSISDPVQNNGESVNIEAVKIFLNVLTPRKVAEQLTLIDAVSWFCFVFSEISSSSSIYCYANINIVLYTVVGGWI